ncbi:hypothetical protein [Demetria terragena]|uniref:hypothetical protein n=1 Tax=Demetria terragena TaxID=63959 RepID=UPI00047685D9|nr:hypothetical protein [Demetria terragena]
MPDEELVHRVALTTGLPSSEAIRVIEDVIAWHSESVEEFVRRRHTELQLRGTRNEQAFGVIAAELRNRPVRAPELSERQLRRIIYS